jgi:site-specific DNA recombinase
MSTAVYIRVSTIEQAAEGYSLAAQERLLREHCARLGDTVHSVYADDGISGRRTENRPGFVKMMKDAQTHAFDVILVWSVSRLSRSVSDLYNTWEILDSLGIAMKSQSEPIDTSTAMGKAMFGLLGIFAQLESDLTSERVKLAMSERARQGKRTCNYVLGYDKLGKDTFVINAREAEIVQYIFEKYIDFRNLSAVAECCKLKGYVGRKKRPFSAESVKKILTRPIYIGYNSFRGQIYTGLHEPIIPKKTFLRVQKMLGRKEFVLQVLV